MQNQKKRASYVETTVQIVLILSLYKLSFLRKFYFIFFIFKKISLLPDALAVCWVKLCLLLSVFISFALYGSFFREYILFGIHISVCRTQLKNSL